MDGSFSNNPFEGEETVQRIGNFGTFLAEATPLVGDAMAAEEIYEELQKPDTNWYMVGALGGAAVLGLFPFVGDAAANLVRAGARKRFGPGEVLNQTQAPTLDPPQAPPLTQMQRIAANRKKPGYVRPSQKGITKVQPPTEKEPGMIVFQGSPHDFEKFDIKAIGTGEGHQAFGHGLYFTDEEDIAKFYKEALSEVGSSTKVKDVFLDDMTLSQKAKNIIDDRAQVDEIFRKDDSKDFFADQLLKGTSNKSIYKEIVEAGIKEKDLTLDKTYSGKTYKAELSAKPEEFLDYDKLMSEQPKILKLLKKAGLTGTPYAKGKQVLGNANQTVIGEANALHTPVPGGPRDLFFDYHHDPEKKRAVQKLTSERLAKAGIKGIKYSAGQLTSGQFAKDATNYVVFDDKLIKMLAKYGIVGSVGITGAGAAKSGLIDNKNETEYNFAKGGEVAMNTGISQEVADILREKHGFSFGDTGAFVSPTGAQVPIMLNEGGLVPGYKPGGYVDPVFAAVKANNEKARAEQEALEAYKASLATAGPTPLEIAQAGYAANQAPAPAAAPFAPLPPAAAAADPNRPGMMLGESGPFIAPGAPDSPIPPQAPLAPTPPPASPVGSATMQSIDVGQPTFSTGAPLPPPVPLAPTPPPVPPTGGVDSSRFNPDDPKFAGFVNSPFYNPGQVDTTVMSTAADGTVFSTGNMGKSYDNYLASLATAPPPEVPAPAQPELTPIQQAAQELQELGETVGFSTKRKQRNDDILVSYKDGTKTSDILKKYGITRKEWNKATSKPGQQAYSSDRSSAIGLKKTGIAYALMSDEERQAVVDSYLAGKAQERKEDKKDEREATRTQNLRNQVKTEAERLFPGDPNAVDKYYDLGNVERIKMAGRDIAEVFDPSLGSLFTPYALDTDPNSDTYNQVVAQPDPDNARSLGILAPTGAITPDPGPMPRPDDLFPAPVDEAGPTIIPDLITPEGGRFGNEFPNLINAANAGTIENPQGLEFTQNQPTPYSELGMSPGAMGGALPGEQVLAGTDDTSTMDAIMAGVNLDKEGSPPKDFIDRLALSESSGNYQSVNSLGYSGLLQFGQPRLDDYNNAFGTDITTKEFAADNDLQDKVNLWHIKDIDKTYDKLDPTALAAAGVDKDGFRAAAHIGGKTGATKFVNSLGAYNPSDANQTSIADYVQKFKKPKPVQTAGLNFSLSDLNPANFFRSAGAATVPSATVPSATVPYEDVDPELANQMQQYSAARQGLIYDPSLNQTYTPESFEEMQRAAAGIDDQGLLSGTRAVLGESIARGTDNALENVGVLATLTGFDGAADALSNAIDSSTFRGRSASAKFADPQIEGPIGFGEGEVDPSIAAAYADSRSGMLDYSWKDLPGAVLEQVPNVVVSSLAAIGTYLAAPAVGLTGTGVTIATGTAAAMPEILQVLGPVALERAQANNREVPNAGDWAAATATAAATGALNAIPFLTGGKPVVSNITGRIVNKFGDMFKEGTTEGLQAFVQQFGATAATEKGLDIDAKQAMAEAVIAGPGGLAVAGGPYRVNTGGPSSAIDAAPSTTVIPGAGPNIATDLNIQSPEAGVVNTTPFNVANLSKVSTPSGISTLAIPGQPGALPTNIDTTQPYTQTPNYLYGAGPTIKPSGVAPGGVANITAPAGDTAVNFPSSFSTLETPAVDQEAMDVIAKVDAGGRPFAMTNNLLRILRNNNITADANTDPAEAIAALKVKASSAPSGVASLSTLGDPSNVTPPKPFVQAQQAIIQEIVETGGLSVKTANRLSNDLNMSMPEITRIAENAMGLDMSTPALSGPAPRTDMLPSGVSTLADTKGIGNLILNPPPVGKVPVRDKDTGKLTSAVANPVKTSIAADPTLLSTPTDTNINVTTDPVTAINPVATTAVDTGPVTETAVDPGTTVPTTATVDIPPEVDEVEIEVDEPTAEDPINIVEEETDDDKPPFECPDGFTAVKVDGQFVCMPDEEEEDDGADTVIQKVRPRIASYYRPDTNAVLENYTPYRPFGR